MTENAEMLFTPLLRGIRPAPYIQNRTGWCWATAAKIVGERYKNLYPCHDVSLVSQGLATEEELEFGVQTARSSGLRTEYAGLSPSGYTVDAWQRAIVGHANTQYGLGYDGNIAASDEEKIRALRFVVTGDADSRDIEVVGLGFYRSARSLLETHDCQLHKALSGGRFMVGNFATGQKGISHSIVIEPDLQGTLRIYDPWDGMRRNVTMAQAFTTGIATTFGCGVIRWVQYIT